MSGTLTYIWRYPIKSHGREELDQVTLNALQTLPWDREWAVAHEGARVQTGDWASCANFTRIAKVPSLMAISASLDEANSIVTLTHPDRPDLSFKPDEEQAAFLDWVKPLMPENRAQSSRILRVTGPGMTDTDYPTISINNLTSHQAVETKIGRELSLHRWRGNLILDGFAAWEEREWVGKTVQIGEVKLEIREEIGRCMATTANPETGERDAPILETLKSWGHQNFGVYGVVTQPGQIAKGDTVSILG